METVGSTAAESKYSYNIQSHWTVTATPPSSSAADTTATLPPHHSQNDTSLPTSALPPRLDFLPLFYPHQSNIYQAQLLHYNKLISPARGGGLQSSALPPAVSASHAQATSRPRSSSKASLREGPLAEGNSSGGGHGSRSHYTPDINRTNVTAKDNQPKMPKQSPELSRNLPPRPMAPSSTISSSAAKSQAHSNSVPSTPHQHARQFSYESREPSPTANNNHSPRSVYSETNSTLPSLRPLPPKAGGCQYETSLFKTRRRIPYTTGNDRLEKLDLRTVKDKLTEEEERKLATDMREVFDRLLPTAAVEQNRKRLVTKLEKIFNEEWPNHKITVHVFGSSGNLLCHDGSDGLCDLKFLYGSCTDNCQLISVLRQSGKKWKKSARLLSFWQDVCIKGNNALPCS